MKEYGAKVSMSHIDNSLDNHEVQYFFSDIKLECLNHIKTSEMTINKTKVKVAEYIKWSNYNQIQSKLKWKFMH